MRRVVLLAIASVLVSGCGGQSHQPLFTGPSLGSLPVAGWPKSNATLVAVCDKGVHEVLTMSFRSFPPRSTSTVARTIEEVAKRAVVIEEATAANVRRLAPSGHTGEAIANLARDRADYESIARVPLPRNGATPDGLLVQFIRANRGCFRTRVRKPING